MSDNELIPSEQLMQAVACGDLDAFDQLVLRHQESAWAIAFRFLGDRHEAEDIVQSAFLRILEAAPRYQPTASFKTYLCRIITRLCLDWREKRKPIYTDKHPESPGPAIPIPERLVAEEREQAVRGAMANLPPNQRVALILVHFEGLRYQEVAMALDVTEKAVERLLARARTTLASGLAKWI